MRIKRFVAADMRTALRMIRDEQGPDAVILSNRPVAGGIEVVAATDYDEALVAQALRAAAPALDALPAAVPAPMSTPVAMATPAPMASVPALSSLLSTPAPMPARASEPALAERESLMSRARAVFRGNDGPTLAELSALAAAPAPPAMPPAPSMPSAADAGDVAPTRFEAMMAALNASANASVVASPSPVAPLAMPAAPAVVTAVAAPIAPLAMSGRDLHQVDATDLDARVAATPALATAAPGAPSAATSALDDWSDADADYHVILSSVAAPVAPVDSTPVAPMPAPTPTAPTLHAIATATSAEPDPAMAAMRADLATMRQLMERQMESLSLERLRGSPARAAAYEALIGYGCEDALAQAVAAKLDPRLEPSQIHQPMFAELARMITVSRSEPIDEGGVIALVGPTGAGKTTTAAKLAARFAARHRARDVALVTTDGERAGAREQLHAHGRRLGITVCEAAGPEGLADALVQLADYPLVLVDTTGFAPRDRALFGQILWLRAARKVRCLLVLPANAHPHDLGEVIRRYRPASPEGVVLTKLDETGRLGSALSVTVRHGLTLAYTTHGQQVPADIDLADATRLAGTLEKLRRAADNPLATDDRATEDRHVFA